MEHYLACRLFDIGSAAYGQNGETKIEQIITQKWVANIINGYEGWVDFRRTGFPKLKPVAASLNNGLIPGAHALPCRRRSPQPGKTSTQPAMILTNGCGGMWMEEIPSREEDGNGK
ncbi:MAG: SusD/RagB family nutrient-binding outer membrane lipoprotein [Saprospiraceae bacterium]